MNLVIECKLFMAKLMYEGAPGAWLHLFTFMAAGKKDNNYAVLGRIHDCSTLQNDKLDEKINEAILVEHEANRPKFSEGKGKFDRIIIEGNINYSSYFFYKLWAIFCGLMFFNFIPKKLLPLNIKGNKVLGWERD